MSDFPLHNEQFLLHRIADGDEIAFAHLFKKYYNKLGDYVVRLTESESLTQEILQDVFLKIWLNRHVLSKIECFNAYLFVVARNYTFNALKQIAREERRKREWVNSVLQEAVNSFHGSDDTDKSKIIDEAVALLPSQQKKVYYLSRMKGIKQQEIARELKISHETVKKHMTLALRFLKNHLRNHLGFILIIAAKIFG